MNELPEAYGTASERWLGEYLAAASGRYRRSEAYRNRLMQERILVARRAQDTTNHYQPQCAA